MSKLIPGANEHPDFAALEARVEAYLAPLQPRYKQGEIGWIIDRAMNMEDPANPRYVIGGSELGVIMGVDNKHGRNVGKLLAEKCHFLTTGQRVEADDHTATAWGHIMEPALARYVELAYDTRHFALEASVVHHTVKNFRYSPDGFVIVRLREADGTEIVTPAVLELKNPYGRIVKGGEVPAHYLPQVMSGMDSFRDLVTHGLFVEANYCVQKLALYGAPVYNPMISCQFQSLNGKKGAERFVGIECVDACLTAFVPGPKFAQYEAIYGELLARLVDGGCFNPTHGVYDIGAVSEAVYFKLTMHLFAVGALTTCASGYLVAEGVDRAAAVAQVKARVAEAMPAAQAHLREAPPIVMATGLFKCEFVLHKLEPYYVAARKAHIEAFAAKLRGQVEAMGGLHPMFTGADWRGPRDLGADVDELVLGMSTMLNKGKKVAEEDFD